MYNDLKLRNRAFYQINVSLAISRDVDLFLARHKEKYTSRSNMVQQAVEQKLQREQPLLPRNPATDPLCLAHLLPDRKSAEKREARRTMRWCIVIDADVDAITRDFLNAYGARHGALCRFVEDAIYELMAPSTRRTGSSPFKLKIPRSLPLPPFARPGHQGHGALLS